MINNEMSMLKHARSQVQIVKGGATILIGLRTILRQRYVRQGLTHTLTRTLNLNLTLTLTNFLSHTLTLTLTYTLTKSFIAI